MFRSLAIAILLSITALMARAQASCLHSVSCVPLRKNGAVESYQLWVKIEIDADKDLSEFLRKNYPVAEHGSRPKAFAACNEGIAQVEKETEYCE